MFNRLAQSPRFEFPDLDGRTRALMMAELELDIQNHSIYFSPRLVNARKDLYIELFREAMNNHDPYWLASQMRSRGYLKPNETRHTASGKVITVHIPNNAHESLAEGEFNRYYIRALCRKILEDGTGRLRCFRAKSVQESRIRSSVMIGRDIDPNLLLETLRNSDFEQSKMGIPGGPNSGISVRIVLETINREQEVK